MKEWPLARLAGVEYLYILFTKKRLKKGFLANLPLRLVAGQQPQSFVKSFVARASRKGLIHLGKVELCVCSCLNQGIVCNCSSLPLVTSSSGLRLPLVCVTMDKDEVQFLQSDSFVYTRFPISFHPFSLTRNVHFPCVYFFRSERGDCATGQKMRKEVYLALLQRCDSAVPARCFQLCTFQLIYKPMKPQLYIR